MWNNKLFNETEERKKNSFKIVGILRTVDAITGVRILWHFWRSI